MSRWRATVGNAPPEAAVPLRLWTLAAVLVSVLALTAHEEFADLRVLTPALIATGYLFSYWRRGRRNWWVKVGLALLCLEVAREFVRDVLVDPLQTTVPLTVFLLWLQVLHSFDVPARRDLLFSLLSSVILMAVAAVFALDVRYLGYLAAYLAAAVPALVQHAWDTTRTGTEGAAGVHAPAGRPREVWPMAAGTLLTVVAATGVLFVVMPRFEGMHLTALPFSPRMQWLTSHGGRIVNPAYPDARDDGAEVPRWNARGYFGFSPAVDLRVRGRLDDRLVMRVRATHAFNWRGLVFDTYTGWGWRASDPQVTEVRIGFPPARLVYRGDEVLSYGARPVEVIQTFFLEAEQPNVLFAAALAERLWTPAGHVYLDRYGAIRLPGPLRPGAVYSVVSRAMVPDPGRLRAAEGTVPAFITARYLQLPPLPDRVHALARRLTDGAPTRYDRVMAVNRYLWHHYVYDLTIPPQRRPGDAVDYFLFEERRGYCEQFASAMVVLLRAAGIPARLVTGYTPGALNPVTGLLEVRNSDAHAWVEVYFPRIGWVEFEPTPGFPDTAALGDAAVPRWLWQGLSARMGARLAALGLRWPWRAGWAPWGALGGPGLLWVVVAAVAGLGSVLVWKTALRPRRRPTRGELRALYETCCSLLARYGVARGQSETLAEYRARAVAATGAPEVDRLLAMVEAVAYGGASLDGAALAAARRDLERLRRRLPWWRRWR
ncbi:MAG: transglutaminaseTgpA domain-containing protein [Armatimonadota bacterium]|nr:transglutaminaseTgpA domain-containing protein [Armatimonadota bacterium]